MDKKPKLKRVSNKVDRRRNPNKKRNRNEMSMSMRYARVLAMSRGRMVDNENPRRDGVLGLLDYYEDKRDG